MEPSNNQFSNIYRKGEDQTGLKTRAVEQRIARETERREIGDTAQGVRDYNRGITGARNAVDIGVTVKDMYDNPSTWAGPVSGSELAKAKAKKIRVKQTAEREKKRR